MSLVTYDVNSDSENEDGNILSTDKRPQKIFNYVPASSAIEKSFCQENPKAISPKNLAKGSMKGKNKTKPPQMVKRRIQISFSSISGNNQNDSDSDDGNPKKQLKNHAKQQLQTCQLLALLPAPKNTIRSTNTSLVPNIVKKIQASQTKTPKNSARDVKIGLKDIDGTPHEDGDIEEETFDDHTWLKICGRRFPKKPATFLDAEKPFLPINSAPATQKPYDGLDNAAFRKLVGKRKNLQEHPIELIDVHEDDLRSAEPTSLKSLTEPNWYNCESNLESKSQVNNTCKAKNHITLLAQKALANDMQLQMRWSEDRHNRRLTQAKYGF